MPAWGADMLDAGAIVWACMCIGVLALMLELLFGHECACWGLSALMLELLFGHVWGELLMQEPCALCWLLVGHACMGC